MKNEQLLNNLIEKKAQLEKELAAINEMIKLEEAKAAAPTAEAPTAAGELIGNVTVEVTVTEKETSKGTEYSYTVFANGVERWTRKSKKKYIYVILFELDGGIGMEGFSTSEKSAQSAARGWSKVGGKGRVFTI